MWLDDYNRKTAYSMATAGAKRGLPNSDEEPHDKKLRMSTRDLTEDDDVKAERNLNSAPDYDILKEVNNNSAPGDGFPKEANNNSYDDAPEEVNNNFVADDSVLIVEPGTPKTPRVVDLTTESPIAAANVTHCSPCKRHFDSPSECQNHMRSCVRRKKLKCHFCWTDFGNDKEMSSSYTCEDCGRTFKEAEAFAQHARAYGYTMSETYGCHWCGKCFSSSMAVQQHGRVKHNNYSGLYYSYSSKKEFKICDELTDHVRKHPNTTKVYCSQCDMGFLSKPVLKRHTQEVHATKPFRCPVCNSTFTRKNTGACIKII
jgi:hypothetical protein